MLRSIMVISALGLAAPLAAQSGMEGEKGAGSAAMPPSASHGMNNQQNDAMGQRDTAVPATREEMRRPAQDQAMMQDMMKGMDMKSCQMHCEKMMGMGGPLNIESNWGRFDKGGKGYLTPLEFGEWVMETNGQSTAAVNASRHSRKSNLPSVRMLNQTAVDLARVDTNHDWRITRDELAAVAE